MKKVIVLILFLGTLFNGFTQSLPCGMVVSKADVRALYVSRADDIILAPDFVMFGQVNQHGLLKWAKQNNFNHLILYGITGMLNEDSPTDSEYHTKRQKLGSFIRKAHEFYEITVSINISSYNSAQLVTDFLDYPLIVSDPFMQYDGLHYEQEYWNGAIPFEDLTPTPAIDSFKESLAWLFNFCVSRNLLCETYIGNPTHGTPAEDLQGQAEIDFIASNCHRIHVAYYRPNPFSPSPNFFKSKLWRWDFLENTGSQAKIIVLQNAKIGAAPNMNTFLHSLAPMPFTQRWYTPYHVWMDCNEGYYKLPVSSVEILGYSWYRFQDLHAITIKLTEKEENHVKLSPNPAKDFVNITLEKDETPDLIEIYTLNGVLITKFNNTKRISLNNVQNGTYQVYIYFSKGVAAKKLMVKHY